MTTYAQAEHVAQYKWSAYLGVDVGADDVLLTSFLSRAVLRLSLRAYEQACDQVVRGDMAGDLAEALLRDGFVIRRDIDEWAIVADLHRLAKADSDVLDVTLAPTLKCNLACHYCFQSKQMDAASGAWRTEVMTTVANRLQAHTYKALHIHWFGGEPLLATEVIEALSADFRTLASRNGLTFDAEVTTNAVLLKSEISSKLADWGVNSIQATFEGAEDFHNKVRRGPDTPATFASIVENLQACDPRIAIVVRVHVAPYSLSSAKTLIDQLAAAGLARRVAKLYFAPLFHLPADRGPGLFVADDRRYLSARQFASAQLELLRRAKAAGFNIGDALDSDYAVCAALKDHSFMIGPNGRQHQCYFDFERPAELTSAPTRAEYWAGYDPGDDLECRTCTVAPVCLGGCAAQRAEGAAKAAICSPLKFNYRDRMRLQFDG